MAEDAGQGTGWTPGSLPEVPGTAEWARMRERKNANSRAHLVDYIQSDGARGYFRELPAENGPGAVVHLVLRTVGRTTGRPYLTPLIYAPWADECLVVASKSGHPKHPAWYLNLTARPEVEWQVRDRRFRGTWRVAEGEERTAMWEFLCAYVKIFPRYQARTSRLLPIVVLTPSMRIEERWTVPEYAYVGLGAD